MAKSLTELCSEFRAFKTKSEELKTQLGTVNTEWDECEKQLMDAMIEEGVASVRMPGIGLFSMSTQNMLNVTADNKPSFYEYLQESGNGGLLKLDVNPRTLTAFLKDHLAEVIKRFEDEGKDFVEARDAALEFLKNKGAAYFSKKTISLRSSE